MFTIILNYEIDRRKSYTALVKYFLRFNMTNVCKKYKIIKVECIFLWCPHPPLSILWLSFYISVTSCKQDWKITFSPLAINLIFLRYITFKIKESFQVQKSQCQLLLHLRLQKDKQISLERSLSSVSYSSTVICTYVKFAKLKMKHCQ